MSMNITSCTITDLCEKCDVERELQLSRRDSTEQIYQNKKMILSRNTGEKEKLQTCYTKTKAVHHDENNGDIKSMQWHLVNTDIL